MAPHTTLQPDEYNQESQSTGLYTRFGARENTFIQLFIASGNVKFRQNLITIG